MLCAVFSRPQDLPEYIILWSQLENQEGETTIWQLRRRPRRRPRKRAERNPPRRDSSFTQGTTTTTFKWRTSSKAVRPTLKGTANAYERAVPIVFYLTSFPDCATRDSPLFSMLSGIRFPGRARSFWWWLQ